MPHANSLGGSRRVQELRIFMIWVCGTKECVALAHGTRSAPIRAIALSPTAFSTPPPSVF